MVTRNRNRVELGHILRRVLEDIGDNAHRELGRVDIGVTHHELLQNVVLNRTGQLVERSTLLETRHDVEGQNRQHGTVHGHRHRHTVERNTVEEDLHILHRANRHTGLTYVTHYTRVVGIVATVRSQVKGYRKTLLAGSQVTTIEGIRLLGGRETCILTNRPGTHHIHRRIGTAQEGSHTCSVVQMLHACQILGRVHPLHGNLLGRHPRLLLLAALLGAALLGSTRIFQFRKFSSHNSIPVN